MFLSMFKYFINNSVQNYKTKTQYPLLQGDTSALDQGCSEDLSQTASKVIIVVGCGYYYYLPLSVAVI